MKNNKVLRIRVSEEDYYFCSSKGSRGMSAYIRGLLAPDREVYFKDNPIIRNATNKHPGWTVKEVKRDGTIVIEHRSFNKPEEITFKHPDYEFFKDVPIGQTP